MCHIRDMENNTGHEPTMETNNSVNYLATAKKLTYRQLQQLCKQAANLGFIDANYKVNKKRAVLELMAVAIYSEFARRKAAAQ